MIKMKMVFKSLSNEKLDSLKNTRDFLENLTYETIILVPHGVKEIYIIEEQSGQYTVSLRNEEQELDVVQGLLALEYARIYAETVAKEAGLSEETIRIIQFNQKNQTGYKEKN
jgi:hypothetical protein